MFAIGDLDYSNEEEIGMVRGNEYIN